MQVASSREDSKRLLKHGGAATHARRDARDAQPSLRSSRQPTEGHDIMTHMLKRHTSDWYRTNALPMSAVDECGFSWYHAKVYMTAGLGFVTDVFFWHMRNYEIVLLFGGIALVFLSMATITGSNPAMISDEVFAAWSTAIAFEFVLTSCACVMSRVFTPQGWEMLANTLTALVGRLLGRARWIGNGGQSRKERRKRARRHPGTLR